MGAPAGAVPASSPVSLSGGSGLGGWGAAFSLGAPAGALPVSSPVRLWLGGGFAGWGAVFFLGAPAGAVPVSSPVWVSGRSGLGGWGRSRLDGWSVARPWLQWLGKARRRHALRHRVARLALGQGKGHSGRSRSNRGCSSRSCGSWLPFNR